MIANIQRQPYSSISVVSSGAAMPVPRVDALLKMPDARPRSRTLNQSRTTRPPVGNCGASPMPRATRAAANWATLPARPHSSCAVDQTARPPASSRLGPSRSISGPTGNWAKA